MPLTNIDGGIYHASMQCFTTRNVQWSFNLDNKDNKFFKCLLCFLSNWFFMVDNNHEKIFDRKKRFYFDFYKSFTKKSKYIELQQQWFFIRKITHQALIIKKRKHRSYSSNNTSTWLFTSFKLNINMTKYG